MTNASSSAADPGPEPAGHQAQAAGGLHAESKRPHPQENGRPVHPQPASGGRPHRDTRRKYILFY